MTQEIVDVGDLAPGEMRPITIGDREVLVCRVGNACYAIENRCPHASVPLSRGRLRGHVLECPFHGGKLDVRDGSPQALPIRRRAITFSAREVERGLEIDTAERSVSNDVPRQPPNTHRGKPQACRGSSGHDPAMTPQTRTEAGRRPAVGAAGSARDNPPNSEDS